jgi:hypothetical protein
MGQGQIIILYVIAICLLSLLFVWFFFKVIEEIDKWKERRFKSNKAHFCADLFSLQNKWAKKGELDYAAMLGTLMETVSYREDEPDTEYGKEIKRNNV